MSSNSQRAFPRINFVALLVAALFLVSVFLSWWGIDAPGGFLFRWTLWSGPNTIYISSAESAQLLVTYGPLVGVLVIASAALVLIGTIPRVSSIMIISSALAAIAPISYVIIVNQAISNACSGMPNCITGPFGTKTFAPGFTVSWGFQPGFYLEIVGAVLSVIAIAFQRTFLSAKTS